MQDKSPERASPHRGGVFEGSKVYFNNILQFIGDCVLYVLGFIRLMETKK